MKIRRGRAQYTNFESNIKWMGGGLCVMQWLHTATKSVWLVSLPPWLNKKSINLLLIKTLTVQERSTNCEGTFTGRKRCKICFKAQLSQGWSVTIKNLIILFSQKSHLVFISVIFQAKGTVLIIITSSTGTNKVSEKLSTYPSPKLTFCPKWEVSVNVSLGEA